MSPPARSRKPPLPLLTWLLACHFALTMPARAAILDLSSAPVVESSIHGGNPVFDGENAFDGSSGTRWAAVFTGGPQWIYVDLQADATISSVTIDWETAVATSYEIRMRTEAQGPTNNPSEWTRVATVSNANGLPGGGAVGDDHLFDFAGGLVTSLSGLGGTNAIDVTSPTGRYLMVHATGYAGSCCNGASIWEVKVDASAEPVDPIVLGHPVLSEFMADNSGTLTDEDGASSDWIEIHNATTAPLNLAGWHLTDDPALLTKWTFPSLLLAPDEYYVVFASGKDRGVTGSELHTNFQLQDAGEYLALVEPNGTTIATQFSPLFPPQEKNVSYGTLGQDQTIGYFTRPTPWNRNLGPQGLPADPPQFSHPSGLISSSFNLTLSALSPTAEIRYTLNGTAPTESSTLYAGPLHISNATRINARVYDPAAGSLPSEVRGREFIELGADLLDFNSNLPLVVIDSFGVNIDSLGKDVSRVPVFSVFLETDEISGRSAIVDPPQYAGRAGMRVRGSSSTGFPKKQYSFETWDADSNDLSVSLLGMPAESDWVLYAPYSDKTLMRNHLSYRCFEAMGNYSVRTRFFELFYNSGGGAVTLADYRGVYLLVERIKRDNDRVDIHRLDPGDVAEPEITGGYIFKQDRSGPGDTTFSTATEGVPLVFHEPEAPVSAQTNWLRNYLNTFEAALHGSRFADPVHGYAKYIDVPSWIDQHLAIEVFKNIDGYRLSTFYTKDRNKKIVAGPVWDYNLALGNANYLQGENPTGWYYEQIPLFPLPANNYPWYARLFQDPAFELRYWDRYHALRRGKWRTNNILAEIDGIADLLEEASVREFNRWPRLGTYIWPNAGGVASRTTYRSEVTWMRTWLRQRLNWFDSLFDKPPTFIEQGGVETVGGNVPAGFTFVMADPNGEGGTIYYTTDGSDPQFPTSNAQAYSGALTLNESLTVTARLRDPAGNWSASNVATFIVDALPADASNLVVSEFHYHPGEATQAELDAGFVRNDFEFVELMNIGNGNIDLSGVAFTSGIDFQFNNGDPAALTLGPGARVLVVENQAAFAFRYGALPGVTIAGVYGGNLDNDGERLVLMAGDGVSEIRNFVYNDQLPWPPSADGAGYSLVLVAPETNPDHNNALHWRPSVAPGGSPGGSDATRFVGDPDADDDLNGLSNFIQYAVGTGSGGATPHPTATAQSFTVNNLTDRYLLLTYQQNLAADDVIVEPQISSDLINWQSGPGFLEFVSRLNNEDGTATILYRSASPLDAAARQFVRLLATARE